MFKINSRSTINPRAFMSKFELDGRNTDLIRMANSQHFKYIDGVGEGAFLMQAADVPSGKTCVLSTYNSLGLQDYTTSSGGEPDYSSEVNYTLLVKDKFVFNLQSVNPVVLVYTRELKGILEENVATRNYNVIDQRSLEDDTVYIVYPDRTPKTIDEIINDILTEVAVVIDSPNIPVPYDFFVQGLNLVELIDLYCKAYGLIWTVYYEDPEESASESEEPELIIHIFALSTITPNPDLISDMNFQYFPQETFTVETVHPIVDCCLKSPQAFYNKGNESGGLKTIKIYCPYYPAIVDSSSTEPSSPLTDAPELEIVNEADVDNCSQFIADNLNHYSKFENHYFVNNFIKPFDPAGRPEHTEIRYHFNGYGYRTIFFSGRFHGIPIPLEVPFDKQARNVVASVAYSFKQDEESSVPIPYFLVQPLYGLDGWIDAGTLLPVVNIFEWNFGFAESIVRIEWDCHNRRWIPLQLEYFCPPETTFPEVPDPPIEEERIPLNWSE